MLHFSRRQFLKITSGFVAGTATVGSFSLFGNLKANAVGSIITLKCLGDQDGPRFLDGRTASGTVGLAPSTEGGFTGTKWEIFIITNGTITLKCLGDQEGPRFLDGRTFDGSVALAPSTEGGFTGTKWEATPAGAENIWTLKCLGDQDGPRFLDGRTASGTVGLAPSTEGGFTGTRWEIGNVN